MFSNTNYLSDTELCNGTDGIISRLYCWVLLDFVDFLLLIVDLLLCPLSSDGELGAALAAEGGRAVVLIGDEDVPVLDGDSASAGAATICR